MKGLSMVVTMGLVFGACNLPEAPKAVDVMPDKYAQSHMPEGWWNDKAIVDEGRLLYLGKKKSNVNCAECHGHDGRPVRGGARDFRNAGAMRDYSDSHLFWRISEGVPFSPMKGYKNKLSEKEIWKVIVFISTFGMDGLHYDPKAQEWTHTG